MAKPRIGSVATAKASRRTKAAGSSPEATQGSNGGETARSGRSGVLVQIWMPEPLVSRIDRACRPSGSDRSSWIRLALDRALRDQALRAPKARLASPLAGAIPVKCASCGLGNGAHDQSCVSNPGLMAGTNTLDRTSS